MFDAMSAFGVAHHDRVVLLALGDCPVAAIDHWNFTTKAPGFGCDAFRKSALAEIASLHPAAVVVADDAGVRNHNFANVDTLPAAYAVAEVVTLRALGAPGRHVVLMGDTPDPLTPLRGQDPTECLSIHIRNISACSFARTAANALLMIAAPVAAKLAGASFIPQTDWFCTTTTCPLVVGHTAVYLNGSHATRH